jgi:hypothetical protein
MLESSCMTMKNSYRNLPHDESIVHALSQQFEPDTQLFISNSTQLENKFLEITMELLAENLVE